MQSVAGTIIDLFADYSLDRLISVHEREKSKILLGGRIDKNIDIGVRSGLIARMRSEQVKRRHPEPLEGRFGLFQLGYDFIAAHAFQYIPGKQFFPPRRKSTTWPRCTCGSGRSVKAAAVRMAQEDKCSMAEWLEWLIEAEAA